MHAVHVVVQNHQRHLVSVLFIVKGLDCLFDGLAAAKELRVAPEIQIVENDGLQRNLGEHLVLVDQDLLLSALIRCHCNLRGVYRLIGAL